MTTAAMGRALLRAPPASLASACELSFIDRTPIEAWRVEHEHQSYRNALVTAGLAVTMLPALEALPDSVFVGDDLLVLPELIVLTRPGVGRQGHEVGHIDAAVRAWAPGTPVARITAPATLDGGDVLRTGRTLHVGLGVRSNEAAVTQLRQLLSPHGYRVQPVHLRRCLRLKAACSALDEETLLINERWLDAHELRGFRLLGVDVLEPFAANVLSVGRWCLANAAMPRTLDLVAGHAARARLNLAAVSLAEFQKAEAGPTCLSAVQPT